MNLICLVLTFYQENELATYHTPSSRLMAFINHNFKMRKLRVSKLKEHVQGCGS